MDGDGHGTHTSTTAGGSFAANASYFGFANGTAKGGAPHARIAMYKVCWVNAGCSDADIMAAFDDGISDGVDVFSLSLSNPQATPFFEDGVAIGSFHAAQQNISVVCAAGNSGPTPGSVSNVAPWLTSVAASTVDRKFASSISLGDNVTSILVSLSLSSGVSLLQSVVCLVSD
jgi:hypothetical protein